MFAFAALMWKLLFMLILHACIQVQDRVLASLALEVVDSTFLHCIINLHNPFRQYIVK